MNGQAFERKEGQYFGGFSRSENDINNGQSPDYDLVENFVVKNREEWSKVIARGSKKSLQRGWHLSILRHWMRF